MKVNPFKTRDGELKRDRQDKGRKKRREGRRGGK